MAVLRTPTVLTTNRVCRNCWTLWEKRIELNGGELSGEKEIVFLKFLCVFIVTSGAFLVFWYNFT